MHALQASLNLPTKLSDSSIGEQTYYCIWCLSLASHPISAGHPLVLEKSCKYLVETLKRKRGVAAPPYQDAEACINNNIKTKWLLIVARAH